MRFSLSKFKEFEAYHCLRVLKESVFHFGASRGGDFILETARGNEPRPHFRITPVSILQNNKSSSSTGMPTRSENFKKLCSIRM